MTLLQTHSRAIVFAVLLVLCGCQTPAPPPPVNFAEAGWTIRRGQAAWRTGNGGQAIAGELVVAGHVDGRAFVQFTKAEQPIVTGHVSAGRWQVQFASGEQMEGFGSPPSRLIWLHLPKFINGAEPPSRWKFQRQENAWRLDNPTTGESLEGFTAP